jgi:hypothetical protein
MSGRADARDRRLSIVVNVAIGPPPASTDRQGYPTDIINPVISELTKI